MDTFFKALIEFFVDFFAALADFLGWTINYDDLLPTDPAADEEAEA